MANIELDAEKREHLSELRILRTLTVISMVADIAALILTVIGNFGLSYIIPISVLLLVTIGGFVFLTRGIPLPAKLLLPTTLFIVVTYIVIAGYGLHDINVLAYAVVIGLASLTLGQTASLVFAFLIIVSVFGIGIAEMRGILVSPTSALTLFISPIAISVVVLAIASIQRTLINLLNENVRQVQNSEKRILEQNQTLQTLNAELEQRVEARTAELVQRGTELELAKIRMERRASQLQAISNVARNIASVQDLAQLLPEVTRLISERFGFYHVGVFLLDVNKGYAVLSAANSEGGRRMLDHGHKLKMGEVGIVGYVTGTGIPRIANDTDEDKTFFNNPDLPATRSEIALPLKFGSEIIGALDVQSEVQNAFSKDDIEVLSTLADQVSTAIQNARLFEETRKSLTEAQETYRRFISQEWQRYAKEQGFGYRYSGGTIEPLSVRLDPSVSPQEKIKTRQLTRSEKLTIPIKLRGQRIGLININPSAHYDWQEDEVDIVETVAERVALAIENARLLEDSQRRASKERTLGEVSSRIGASINMRSVLQVAVEELGRLIPGSEVVIQFQDDGEKK
jgi:GAF domain-containing protein